MKDNYTQNKIKTGLIDPVNLAEQIEQIGTRFRLITDGEPIDLTSPFMAAMLFSMDDVHSILVAVDQTAFEEGCWKSILHKKELKPIR